MRNFTIVAAVDDKFGIAKDGKIPWSNPYDMAWFKALTVGDGNNAVIMGRKTWESLPNKPLETRKNIIIARGRAITFNYDKGQTAVDNIEAAMNICEDLRVDNIFVIGGESIYKQAIDMPECQTIYLTHIDGDYKCDQFFKVGPHWQSLWAEIEQLHSDKIHIVKYVRRPLFAPKPVLDAYNKELRERGLA